jgi:hypothetical protein
LCRLDHTDQSRGDHRSGKLCFLDQDEHIHRIAIVTTGRWNESEVEGKRHPLRQQAIDSKRIPLRIVFELRPVAARCLDDRAHERRLRFERGQIGE